MKVIRKIVEKVSFFIGLSCSLFYREPICSFFYVIRNFFYTGLMTSRFRKFDGVIKGGTIRVSGGKFIQIGAGTIIYNDCRIEAVNKHQNQRFSPELVIGSNTIIRNDGVISCFNKIYIGNNVRIAPRVFISDATHGTFKKEELANTKVVPLMMQQNVADREIFSKGPIIIEDSVHIGINCVIMPGVTIGHNSIIKASAVVTKSVPPYSIVSGIPGKIDVTFNNNK